MIRLNSNNLTQSTTDHLNSRQADIDSKPSFTQQSDRAKSLWASKTVSLDGKIAFSEIKDNLIRMCVGVEICNYCENNEATDIEHIYPKSHFPARAFHWENYLLACKTCNTTWKSDKFRIFNPAQTDSEVDISRGSGKPPTDDTAFINPRSENPMDFIILDIRGNTFRFSADPRLSTRDIAKANYTIELLGLNDRDALVAARKSAAKFFISRLEKYIQFKESKSFNDLQGIVDDMDKIDTGVSFPVEQSRLMESVKKEILKYSHPTVWKEFIRQRAQLKRTNNLLNRAPEALSWINA